MSEVGPYDGTTTPPGFTASADVTYGGAISADAAGTITSTLTAVHANGDTTYSVADNGTITP